MLDKLLVIPAAGALPCSDYPAAATGRGFAAQRRAQAEAEQTAKESLREDLVSMDIDGMDGAKRKEWEAQIVEAAAKRFKTDV